MSDPQPDARATRFAGSYDAAALDYGEASERFWRFLSLRTVELMALAPGGQVLDVASGPGVSTVAAAARVGQTGRVIALDSSEQMLRMAQERANSEGVDNVDTRLGDMAQLDFPPASFDAVVSVLGVFFVPDMPALVSSLWSLLKPGGQLAITTFGVGAFSPALEIWKDAVRAARPEASLTFSWERTEGPDQVRALLEGAGIGNPTVHVEQSEVAIPSPDDWWLAVMGSSMRRTVLEMDDDTTVRVRTRCTEDLIAGGITSIQMPAVYALATKD